MRFDCSCYGITIHVGSTHELNGLATCPVASFHKLVHKFSFCFQGIITFVTYANSGKKQLLNHFFSLGMVQAVTSLLQLLVIPFVISKVGVAGFGIIAVAQVVMFYLSALTEFGFNQTASRDVVILQNDHAQLSRIFFRVIFSKLILCFISFVILVLLIMVVPVFRVHAYLYIAAFVFVIGQAISVNWFFQGLQKMHLMAFMTLCGRMLFVIFVFLFIRSAKDDVLYLFFLGAGNFIMGLISIFLSIKGQKLQFIMPTIREIRDEYNNGWQVTATNLANNICQYSNIFILRLFTNDLVTGYYGIAERIFLTLKQMHGVFSQATYPQVCMLVRSSRQKMIDYFRKAYLPFLLIVLLGSTLLFILSPWVLAVFIGKQGINAIPFLRLFTLVLVITCLSIPATLVLLAKNRTETYFKVYALGAVLNIALNVFLSNFFGATGTVTAIIITELFILVALNQQLNTFSILNPKKLEISEL